MVGKGGYFKSQQGVTCHLVFTNAYAMVTGFTSARLVEHERVDSELNLCLPLRNNMLYRRCGEFSEVVPRDVKH